ncbi:hypothetical protein DPM19_16195 [Actinomadura craniellae]|uniref:MucB/RseB N-terminal domain-containing protein n=1 Tax=Actinomadura craniellae TaxID=2231787 RepID=A0A365H5U9_9ACTN|nr:sigma-E factor regulatory protein RseB domain-containing protein [Actinomadura craniellae]RAY14490.1 hypothetical protein DPM19_16195 [Actinomadura craniellae]
MIQAGCTRRGTWAVGGLATAVMLLWVVPGDAAANGRRAGDSRALRLLRDAAAAARQTPYEGMQFVTTWGRNGAATSLLDVSHTPGAGTTLHVRQTVAQRGGSAYRPDDTEFPGGLSGFSPRALDLLTRNYTLVRAADDSICGRPAQVVEARRADGTPAGRFWLDRGTGLMLHRELLDERGRAVSSTGFYDLRITAVRAVRLAGSRSGGHLAGTPLGATALSALRRAGWQVPAALPGRLTLQDARRTEPGPVLHLTYTDGLAAVSLFIQRGRLDERKMGGWRKVEERGRTVFQRDAPRRWTVWADSGHVYTVLTDAPQTAADQVVFALPDQAVGFWARMRRGAVRLGSLLNPFG